jgi:shikimate dehydrogenase
MTAIGGATRVLSIIGSPITQVKMPQIMNAWCADQGADIVMVPLDVAADRVGAMMDALRGWKNSPGMVVTVPYKQIVAARCDDLTPRARRLTTANVVRRDPDGKLTGDILDGVGFIEAARGNGLMPENKRAAVIGAGGVASAIANSLCENGVGDLLIQDVDTAKRDALAATLRAAFPATRVGVGIARADDLDVLVNGTPVGMNGDPSLPLSRAVLSGLRGDCFVADVVTVPTVTPFLALARDRGCVTQTGIEMARPQLPLMLRFLGITP